MQGEIAETENRMPKFDGQKSKKSGKWELGEVELYASEGNKPFEKRSGATWRYHCHEGIVKETSEFQWKLKNIWLTTGE